MDGVGRATVEVQIFALEGGGGGKYPELPTALKRELDKVIIQDPDFKFGVKCAFDFYSELPDKFKQSLESVNIEANCLAIVERLKSYERGGDLTQEIETRRKIANFKKGFYRSIEALKEIILREREELQRRSLNTGQRIDPARVALLDRILKGETNTHPCYLEGIKSGFDYYNHMPVEDRPLLKSFDLERIFDELVSSLPLDRLVRETEDKLENFKGGFCKGLGEIIKARGQGVGGLEIRESLGEVVFTDPKQEESFLIGKSAAETYYKDPVNRDLLKELYKDRAKLRGAFNTFAIKNKLDLKFSRKIGIANGGELNWLDTKKFEECYQGFMSTLEALLNKDEEKFKLLDLSIEDLAKQFEEPSAPIKKAKNKKTKEPRTRVQETPPIKVEKKPVEPKTLASVKKLPQKESADQKRVRIAEKRIEEFAIAENQQELLEMQQAKLARMQIHPATLKGALEAENYILSKFTEIVAERYAMKQPVEEQAAAVLVESPSMSIGRTGLSAQICSVLVRLELTNRWGNPMEFNGSYTQVQIQTLKVCVLHMINSGMLSARNPVTLEYSAEILSTRLPDNSDTPSNLYGLLGYGYLDVLEVLEKAGF